MVMLTAPREKVCNQAFNVGRTEANYRVREIAALVQKSMPGTRLEYAPDAGPDPRCYRVDSAKLHRVVPDFEPKWTLEAGIEQLIRAFRDYRLEWSDFEGPKFTRLKRLQRLINQDLLDRDLRWIPHYIPA
jgi:nucleoside-diphosphate-sugar epimerase